MHCKACEYPLWGIRDRVCPECGEEFKPSDFEFRPGAVRFACPACGQDYYGTGAQGHLEPPEFACVSCGAPCAMDDMALAPAEGVAEDATSLIDRKNPWEKRKGFGFFGAWLKTIVMALFAPRRLMQRTGRRASVGAALWFAVFTNMIFILASFSVIALIGLAVSGGGSGLLIVGVIVGWMVSLALGILGAVVVWSLIAHALLRFTGGVSHGLGRTMQGISYASGANVLSAVPLLGFYLAPIAWLWWGLSATLMLREGQRVSWWRAFAAGLGPPVVVVAGVVGFFIWAMTTAFGPVFAGGGMVGTQSETQMVTTALVASMRANGPPGHALDLIADGSLAPMDLVLANTATIPNDGVVAGTDLAALASASWQEQQQAARDAAAALPAGVVAHRLGDFVFTYHGVDVNDAAQSDVWVVIASPDPNVNPASTGSAMYWVGLASGAVMPIFHSEEGVMLSVQNSLRASLGVPEIPDPATVTHSAPAVEESPQRSGDQSSSGGS